MKYSDYFYEADSDNSKKALGFIPHPSTVGKTSTGPNMWQKDDFLINRWVKKGLFSLAHMLDGKPKPPKIKKVKVKVSDFDFYPITRVGFDRMGSLLSKDLLNPTKEKLHVVKMNTVDFDKPSAVSARTNDPEILSADMYTLNNKGRIIVISNLYKDDKGKHKLEYMIGVDKKGRDYFLSILGKSFKSWLASNFQDPSKNPTMSDDDERSPQEQAIDNATGGDYEDYIDDEPEEEESTEEEPEEEKVPEEEPEEEKVPEEEPEEPKKSKPKKELPVKNSFGGFGYIISDSHDLYNNVVSNVVDKESKYDRIVLVKPETRKNMTGFKIIFAPKDENADNAKYNRTMYIFKSKTKKNKDDYSALVFRGKDSFKDAMSLFFKKMLSGPKSIEQLAHKIKWHQQSPINIDDPAVYASWDSTEVPSKDVAFSKKILDAAKNENIEYVYSSFSDDLRMNELYNIIIK